MDATACRVRQLAVDIDLAQVILRAQGKADFDARLGATRQGAQRIAQLGILEREAVDFDRHAALIIAVAFQHGGEPVDVASRARDQSEWADGRGLAQRLQIGRRLERIVHVAVSGRGEVDLIRLRVCGTGVGAECYAKDHERRLQPTNQFPIAHALG